MSQFIKDLVTKEHPLYAQRKAEWRRDERRYRGGRHVWKDLIPFVWEEEDVNPLAGAAGDERLAHEIIARQLQEQSLEDAGYRAMTHYQRRQERVTYMNFARRMTEKFVGRLAAEAPKPGEDFVLGALGQIDEATTRDMKVRANQLYYNCDRKGSPFIAWFNEVQRWAMVTGHRWVGVAAPDTGGRLLTLADEQRGVRPYFVHYSPLDAPNWEMGPEGLDFIVLRLQQRVLFKDGQYHGKTEPIRLLYVRRGYDFGGAESAYVAGGWWKFDDQGEPLTDGQGLPLTGRLDATDGRIPYMAFYYEQDDNEMSRSGTTDISNIAVSYMDISSAGDNDAVEGGGRALYLLGADKNANNIATAMRQAGSRHIPVPASSDTDKVPSIFDSGSVSASSAIESALKRKLEEAARIAQDELKRSPDASGVARQMEFMDVQVPRLALMAFNREAAENDMCRLAAKMWGAKDDDIKIFWKKTYDLDTTAEDWLDILDAAYKAGVESPTLFARALEGLAHEKGLPIKPGEWTKIKGEIEEQSVQKEQGGDQDPTKKAPVFA